MKKLLFENKHSIEIETFRLQTCIGELNDLSDFFKKYLLGKLNPEVIKKMISDGPLQDIRELYKSKIADINEITGLKNNKDQILKTMHLPVIDPMELANITKLSETDLQLFDFDDEVSLNSDRCEKHLDIFRYYSDDKDVLSAYESLQDITNKLNTLNGKLHLFPLGHPAAPGSIGYDLSEFIPMTPTGLVLTMASFKKAILKISK
jgi:hypothetical protein